MRTLVDLASRPSIQPATSWAEFQTIPLDYLLILSGPLDYCDWFLTILEVYLSAGLSVCNVECSCAWRVDNWLADIDRNCTMTLMPVSIFDEKLGSEIRSRSETQLWLWAWIQQQQQQ